jgi:hypothetical protein
MQPVQGFTPLKVNKMLRDSWNLANRVGERKQSVVWSVVGPSDGLWSEGSLDEQGLSDKHPPQRPLHFADHLYHFIASDGSPGSMKGPESLFGIDPSLDRSVVCSTVLFR